MGIILLYPTNIVMLVMMLMDPKIWNQVKEAVKTGDVEYLMDLIEEGWRFSGPSERKDGRMYIGLTSISR